MEINQIAGFLDSQFPSEVSRPSEECLEQAKKGEAVLACPVTGEITEAEAHALRARLLLAGGDTEQAAKSAINAVYVRELAKAGDDDKAKATTREIANSLFAS